MRRSVPLHALAVQRVAAAFHIPIKEIYRENRHREVSLTRHIAMFLLRRALRMDVVSIGQAVGHRHHAAVIFAERKVLRILAMDNDLRHRVQALADELCPDGNVDILAVRSMRSSRARGVTGNLRRRARRSTS